jgi:hypothetical protein
MCIPCISIGLHLRACVIDVCVCVCVVSARVRRGAVLALSWLGGDLRYLIARPATRVGRRCDVHQSHDGRAVG